MPMNIGTYFDFNHHIAFISTYTKVGTLYMKRHHYHANGIYYYKKHGA